MAVELIAEKGEGRPLVILCERDDALAPSLFQLEGEGVRTLCCACTTLERESWDDSLEEVRVFLEEHGIRHASFIGSSGTTSLLQAIGLKSPKMVRHLILVDPHTRPAPSKIEQVINKIEQWLPLGLPFRMGYKGFDSAPSLHRMRCPVLLVLTHSNTTIDSEEEKKLTQGIPTAWVKRLPIHEGAEFLQKEIQTFLNIAPKVPMKGKKTDLGSVRRSSY